MKQAQILTLLLLAVVFAGCLSRANQTGASLLPEDSATAFFLVGSGANEAQLEVVAVAGQQFDRAVRVVVPRAMGKPWDVQLRANVTAPVNVGNQLHASFWIRNPVGETRVPFLFEHQGKNIDLSQRVAAGTQWQRHEFKFSAKKDYPAGKDTRINFQLGDAQQTIEVGGITLTNLSAAAPPAQTTLGASLLGTNGNDAFFLIGGAAHEATLETVDIQGQAFDRAVQVTVPRKMNQPWEVQLRAPIVAPIKSGDPLVATFWARNIAGGQQQVPFNFDHAGKVAHAQRIAVEPEWTRFEIKFTAKADYPAGKDTRINFQLGGAQQTFQLGGIIFVNTNTTAAAPLQSTLITAKPGPPTRGTSGIWFPADSNAIDVTQSPYNADRTGKQDATAAIQSALDDWKGTITKRHILYFPDGIYRISDTLHIKDSKKGHGIVLQGQSRDGTVLRLADNLPGFANTNDPRPVFTTHAARYSKTTSNDGFTNVAFMNNIYDLTFDIGSGNPGASGVQYIANNQGSMRNVLIRSSDPQQRGWAGIDMERESIPGPALVTHVEVDGFDHGIRIGGHNYGMTFEHVTLRNQRVAGLRNNGNILSIRDLRTSLAGPALQNIHEDGFVTLLDSIFVGGKGGAAIENSGYLFARDIETSGYERALLNKDKPVAGTRIREYVQGAVLNQFGEGGQSLRLPIRETRAVPRDNPDTWVSVAKFGAPADSRADASDAIQKAIDSMQDSQTTLYFPTGDYFIGQTIQLRGNVRRIEGLHSMIHPLKGFAEKAEPMFRVEDGAHDAMMFDALHSPPQNWARRATFIEHTGTRDVVMRNMSVFHGKVYAGRGTGNLFIEDVAGLSMRYWAKVVDVKDVQQPQFEFNKQNVWARQLNTEQLGLKVRNDGGQLWILNLKTEDPGTVLEARAGLTEVLGGTILPSFAPHGGAEGPAFIIGDGARVALNIVEHISKMKYSTKAFYPTVVQETHNGQTKTIAKADAPGRLQNFGFAIPLYVSAAAQ